MRLTLKSLTIGLLSICFFWFLVHTSLLTDEVYQLKSKKWETFTWKEKLGQKKEIGYHPGDDGILLDHWVSPYITFDGEGHIKIKYRHVYLVRLYEKVGTTVGWYSSDDNPRFFEMFAGNEERIRRRWRFTSRWEKGGKIREVELSNEDYLRIKPGGFYTVQTNWWGAFKIKQEFLPEVDDASSYSGLATLSL